VNDANAVADTLHNTGYLVTHLIGGRVTRGYILSYFDNQLKHIDPEDLLIIYFSGRSVIDPNDKGNSFLITDDVDISRVSTTSVSLKDLILNYLLKIKNVVIILDSVHSGYTPADNDERTCVVLAAAGSGKSPQEIILNDSRHGQFTYWLLEHWRNHPGAVDINSLYSSVAQAAETADMPMPVLSGVQSGRIVLRPALSPAEVQKKQSPPPASASTKSLVIDDTKVVRAMKQSLVEVLVLAFPDRTYLDKLADFYLGMPLAGIPIPANDIESLVLGVVNWCLIMGGDTLSALLAGALKERPKRNDLRQMVEILTVQDT
jgi:hypothetical protein